MQFHPARLRVEEIRHHGDIVRHFGVLCGGLSSCLVMNCIKRTESLSEITELKGGKWDIGVGGEVVWANE